MTLRRTNWPDVDNLVALNADAEVMRQVAGGLPMTPAQVLSDEMPQLMAYNRRVDQLGYWVAYDAADGAFLGWFAVSPVDGDARTVELSHRLRRSAWAQGYEIEGTQCMIDFARAAGATTVVATTSAGPADPGDLLEQAGLRPVGSTGARHEYRMDLEGVSATG